MTTNSKTALITGGSGGIGQGICLRLAADGMRVVVHYGQNAKGAEEVVQKIKSSGGEAIAVQADVTSESDTVKLFKTAVDHFGGLDVVVANAGVGGGAPIADLELDLFDKVVGANLKGAFLTIREAGRCLAENGRIVVISSLMAVRPIKGSGVYSATKAAMDAMVTSMSFEMGERGITVNSVRPGATVPGMFGKSDEDRKQRFRDLSPFKRLGTPEDIAGVVSFLASKDGGWITGQHLSADGGVSN
jgi:3-oxoacyl-[acyl-carrier protein] reductase